MRRLSADRVLPGLLIDLDDLSRQTELATDETRGRLIGIGALLSGLVAISLVGAGLWSDAERYWRTARRAARASADVAVRGVIASNRAVYGLYCPGAIPAALLGIADEAPALADGAATEGSALAVAARAQLLSMLGDRAEAQLALSNLESVCERLDGGFPARWFYHALTPGAVQVQMHRARTLIVSGGAATGLDHVVATLELVEPVHRPGFIGTSAELALGELPDSARTLPQVRRAREPTSHEGCR